MPTDLGRPALDGRVAFSPEARGRIEDDSVADDQQVEELSHGGQPELLGRGCQLEAHQFDAAQRRSHRPKPFAPMGVTSKPVPLPVQKTHQSRWHLDSHRGRYASYSRPQQGLTTLLSCPLSGTVSWKLFVTLHAIASVARWTVMRGPGMHIASFSGQGRNVR